jgi:oxalate decarboxylase/phosphoglucose isomerase-like protein (cupin superfamily)
MSDSKRYVSPDDVETQQFDWGTIKWLNTPDVTGTESFSAGVVQLHPGKGHARHNHPDSEELLYVVSGSGTQTVADDERSISAGEAVYIPAGVEHSTTNTEWEPLVLLAVYGPPGPEDVLRAMDECTVLPPGELPEF